MNLCFKLTDAKNKKINDFIIQCKKELESFYADDIILPNVFLVQSRRQQTYPTVKAGGIVVKEKNGQKFVLLVYRKKENDWSFPKGHVEPGEEIKDTVLREMEEETGLKTEIIKELAPNEYTNSKTGEKVITHMYLLKIAAGDLKPEYEGDEVLLVKFDEVGDRLSYDNLKEYFDRVKNEL
jgi:ADP-ribose pyrophosphatase YjhB (NUDIX family)